MSNEQVGIVVLGVLMVINLAKELYGVFFKPSDDTNHRIKDKELRFMKELYNANVKNLEYQKEIVEELAKINANFKLYDHRIHSVEVGILKNTDRIESVQERVTRLESK